MIKLFMGGRGVRGGGWGGRAAVKDDRSGVVGVGVIKGSFQRHLKTGWVKAKVVRSGEEGFEGVTTPAPQ